jgi:hypothetical protein
MAQPGSSDAVCERLVGWIASWTWLSTCKTAERAWLWRNENESRFSAAWLARDTTVYALRESACKIHETKHQMHLACSWWFKQPINKVLYASGLSQPRRVVGCKPGCSGKQTNRALMSHSPSRVLVAEFSLSLRVRMTLRGWEFSGFFLKHTTMPYPPKGVGDTYL